MFRADRTLLNAAGNFIHGGGIICYIKEDLHYDIFDFSYLTCDLELTCFCVSPAQRKIYFIVIYRPPSGNIDVALNIIHECISKVNASRKRHTIILLGDFNLDVSISKRQTGYYKLLMDMCANFGLQQLIDRPTRYGPTSTSIIDLIITDCGNIASQGVCKISDHIPCYIIIKKSKESYTKCKFKGRTYQGYNKAQLHELLLQHNWGKFYGCSVVNLAWSLLFSKLLDCCDKLCPVKIFNTRKDKPPWYTDDLYELAKTRDELFLNGRKSKDQTLLSEARYLRNTIKRDT